MFYFYYYGFSAIISTIIFIIILVIRRKPLLWIFLFCLALIPFIALLFAGVNSMLYGSGLVGDSGGIESGLFAIVMLFLLQWYIYIPSSVLLITSFYQTFIKTRK